MYDYEQNVHNVPRRSRDEGFCRIQRQLTIHFKQPKSFEHNQGNRICFVLISSSQSVHSNLRVCTTLPQKTLPFTSRQY